MEIKFLGTGGAFDYKKGTSSAIIETGDKKILIDCGSTVFGSLREHNLVNKIDYVLITHLHGDHVGCLFQLIYFNHYILGTDTKFLYPTEELKDSITAFLDAQNVNSSYYSFTNFSEVENVGYIDTTGMHAPDMLNFAYFFVEDNNLFYYSGDLGNIDATLEFLHTRNENIKIFHDINAKETKSHVYYKEVEDKLRSYEVYGYHCDKDTMPEDCTITLVEDVPELNY